MEDFAILRLDPDTNTVRGLGFRKAKSADDALLQYLDACTTPAYRAYILVPPNRMKAITFLGYIDDKSVVYMPTHPWLQHDSGRVGITAGRLQEMNGGLFLA
jgi:hypothetical protein